MEVSSNSCECYLLSRWNSGKLVLSQPKFTIGRGLNNNYVLEHLEVSRTHCIIEVLNGNWFLTDQSSNGTILNKTKIPPRTQTILSNGDTIKITNEHEFVFVNINKNSLDDIDFTGIIYEADLESRNIGTHSTISRTDKVTNDHTYHHNVNNENRDCTNTNSNIAVSKSEYINKGEASSLHKPIVSENDHKNKELTSSSNIDNDAQPVVLQNANAGIDALEEAENELQCIICTELFIKATTLNCSHSFCKMCIEEWRKKNKKCPICRTKITTANPTIVLDNFITKVVESSSSDVKEKREEVVKSRERAQTETSTTNVGRVLRSRGPPLIEISSGEDNYDDDDDDDDEDFIDNDYDDEYNGLPGRYYGGYGSCYACGQRGHWANGCPYN